MRRNKIIGHVTPVGGNVFADLGFEPAEAARLLAESDAAITAEQARRARIAAAKSARAARKRQERLEYQRAQLAKLPPDVRERALAAGALRKFDPEALADSGTAGFFRRSRMIARLADQNAKLPLFDGQGSVGKLETLVRLSGCRELPAAWVRQCAPAPFASPLAKLTDLLGYTRYDTEHRSLWILRQDNETLHPGELVSVEIAWHPDRQPQMYAEYVASSAHLDAVRLHGRLRPLTLAGLARAIRIAKRWRRGR